MFNKLVAIEPVSLIEEAEKSLYKYANEVIFYHDIPEDDEEIIRRIGDADGVLVSYTTAINKNVIESCNNIKYIGMCCSLYSEESASVDIATAREKGITVLGIRDYGDEGILEYVVSELIRLLHGFGGESWKDIPMELTDLKVGVIGLGTSGKLVANGLNYFGADLYYFSRTRKLECEAQGIKYLPLNELLETVDVVCTCLNKNVILLGDEEFKSLGNHKILFNTGLSPSYEVEALKKWLDNGDNRYFCDTEMALGDRDGSLISHKNVHCMKQSVGRTKQAFDRLSKKVIENIETFLNNENNV